MQFGMPTLIENKDLEETALLCKELGLGFIELNMNLPQYQIEYLEKTDAFNKIADQYGVYYTIHLDENLNFCDFNRTVSKAYFDTVKRTINVAKKMRVPIINMHMNRGVYFTLPDKKIYLFEKYNLSYMSDIKDFKELCNEAVGNSKIKISIENTDGFQDFELTAIECLLESEVFSLTWDIGHSYTAGNIDEPFILKHSDKLGHFHIHDAVGDKNHLTLGSGDINLKERIKIANEYNCRCVIETKTIEALRKSVKWLQK
ncbi:sugar phosphate isomerase/epimerase [Mobilitalea sibirica]|uniref:Sugar phosphate isomerase/epimerase n=1 Tax=Mobilitalea sibirica TaxID=1462919 RepID=A0A8J7L281_9FIRM|nr:sugar phosphate isomerase/epimerase [Mobilitalea sibirica]MBH1940088.1 sugar phosphate isomerase/epimerase [Mobilitalea sibirica]